MAQRKIIGFKSGYMSGPTNAGDQWIWGRRVDSGGSSSVRERNGGHWIAINSSFNDMKGDSYLGTIMDKNYSGHSNVLYDWKVDIELKHGKHYEDGNSKIFTVSDPTGWQYQSKIKNHDEFVKNLDNILYFESQGARKTLYSWCWVSWADHSTQFDYVKNMGQEPVDMEEKNAWWGHTVKSSANSSKSKTAAKGWGNPREMQASRLRNVVGFTMNLMIKGDKNNYMHPACIGLIMNNGGSTMRVAFPTEKFGNSMFMSQDIVGATHWHNGQQNNIDSADWKSEKSKVLELNYVCTQDVISEIVSGKWEFMGLWWKFSTQSTNTSGSGWKAMGFWNFRPIVCGVDGSIGTTWNNNTYNILSHKRRYVDNASLYLV